MTTKNKILSGLVLSTVLASGLFAVNTEMRNNKNSSNCMMKKESTYSGKQHGEKSIVRMFTQLNLTEEQASKIEKIIFESRGNMKTFDEAFTKESFNKDKYMKIMSEKRDNMLESKAEIIEKSYAVLTPKQKEQLKVLMDLKREKINQRIENKFKG